MTDMAPKPFIILHRGEHRVVTRPMVGDPDVVLKAHDWLCDHSIKEEMDFPRRIWWLSENDFKVFTETYSEYIFTKYGT